MIVQSDLAGDGGPRHLGFRPTLGMPGNPTRTVCGVDTRGISWTLDLEQVTCEACKAAVTQEALNPSRSLDLPADFFRAPEADLGKGEKDWYKLREARRR